MDAVGELDSRYRSSGIALLVCQPRRVGRKRILPDSRHDALSDSRGNLDLGALSLVPRDHHRAILALFAAPKLFKLGCGVRVGVQLAFRFFLRFYALGGEVGGAVLEIKQPRGAFRLVLVGRVLYHLIALSRLLQPVVFRDDLKTLNTVLIYRELHKLRFVHLLLIEVFEDKAEILGSEHSEFLPKRIVVRPKHRVVVLDLLAAKLRKDIPHYVKILVVRQALRHIAELLPFKAPPALGERFDTILREPHAEVFKRFRDLYGIAYYRVVQQLARLELQLVVVFAEIPNDLHALLYRQRMIHLNGRASYTRNGHLI